MLRMPYIFAVLCAIGVEVCIHYAVLDVAAYFGLVAILIMLADIADGVRVK